MLDLSVQFSEQLDCGICENVLVWIQNPLLLAVNEGITDPALLKYIFTAHIKDVTCQSATSWTYVLEYPEETLVDPEVPLAECDIKRVCCESCYIQWFNENVNAQNLFKPLVALCVPGTQSGTGVKTLATYTAPGGIITAPGQRLDFSAYGDIVVCATESTPSNVSYYIRLYADLGAGDTQLMEWGATDVLSTSGTECNTYQNWELDGRLQFFCEAQDSIFYIVTFSFDNEPNGPHIFKSVIFMDATQIKFTLKSDIVVNSGPTTVVTGTHLDTFVVDWVGTPLSVPNECCE